MEAINDPISVTNPKAAVKEWFERLGKNCATVDYDSNRVIFSNNVVSFGTKADIVTGLDNLQSNQWSRIWPNIKDFSINLTGIHAGGNDHMAWGVATWTSKGFTQDGASFFRPGRATTVLERKDGKWLSVHTHFSLNPGTPSKTYGIQ